MRFTLPMRIIVETALNSGTAEYQNMGDVAMLQVAVTRLRKLWPSARIEVFTESPENLAVYCPEAEPLSRAGRNHWCLDRDSLYSFFFTRVYEYLPKWLSSCLDALIKDIELRWPALLKAIIHLRPVFGDPGRFKSDLIAFLEAMERADLFLLCGAGGFADSTQKWDLTILATLGAAIRRNIPVALFGQGMGPLNDPEVLSKAKNIFPAANIITLRGGRGGDELLRSLGVAPSKVLTTGDEAIEPAYEARPREIGRALGVNVRVASYSGVENGFIERLRPVLQTFARHHHVPMLPVPIAFHPWASDHQAIRRLLAGLDDQSDGGLSLDTPLKIIEQAGRCRVVVTGAYHAAVFALAQGVPVVCLANSPYYAAKFLGLEDQFGPGCETIFLDDPQVFDKITVAIEKAWSSADMVRMSLQNAALRQIALSRSAYERVKDMLSACET